MRVVDSIQDCLRILGPDTYKDKGRRPGKMPSGGIDSIILHRLRTRFRLKGPQMMKSYLANARMRGRASIGPGPMEDMARALVVTDIRGRTWLRVVNAAEVALVFSCHPHLTGIGRPGYSHLLWPGYLTTMMQGGSHLIEQTAPLSIRTPSARSWNDRAWNMAVMHDDPGNMDEELPSEDFLAFVRAFIIHGFASLPSIIPSQVLGHREAHFFHIEDPGHDAALAMAKEGRAPSLGHNPWPATSDITKTCPGLAWVPWLEDLRGTLNQLARTGSRSVEDIGVIW